MNRFRLTRRCSSLNLHESKRFFLIPPVSASAASIIITKSPLRRRTPNAIHFFTPRIQFPPSRFTKITTFATGASPPPHWKDDYYVKRAATGSGSQEKGEVPDDVLIKIAPILYCDSTAEGGTCNVYLVGTNHVSLESCRKVQAVISYLKPEVVFLELCSSRVAVLSPQNLKVPTMAEMIGMWKKKHKMFGILYSCFLAKIANRLEVFPGSEFRVAYEEARTYGARVVLGDRPVQITLERTWRRMPLWEKTKLVYSLLYQLVFLPSRGDLDKMLKDMDHADLLTLLIQEMSKEYPTLMETLVNERDQYMASLLLRIAGKHRSVVAVIGKAHVRGIHKHWKQPVEMKDLVEIPSQKPLISATRVGVAVAGMAIISGIYLVCKT